MPRLTAAADDIGSAIAVATNVGYRPTIYLYLISGERLPKIEVVVISVKMERKRDPILQLTINWLTRTSRGDKGKGVTRIQRGNYHWPWLIHYNDGPSSNTMQ